VCPAGAPALDGAVGRVRVDAGAGVPALAVDLELGLLGLVAEEAELVKTRLEPGVAKGVGDRLSRAVAAGVPAWRTPISTPSVSIRFTQRV
jgi:hypothetical protein